MARADGQQAYEALLWEVARAKRAPMTDDEGNPRGTAIFITDDLLDRIDQAIGYDEMGN